MKFMVILALFIFAPILVGCEKEDVIVDADTELVDVIEMDEEVVEASVDSEVEEDAEEVIEVDSDTN